jgi:hypothetical protein
MPELPWRPLHGTHPHNNQVKSVDLISFLMLVSRGTEKQILLLTTALIFAESPPRGSSTIEERYRTEKS